MNLVELLFAASVCATRPPPLCTCIPGPALTTERAAAEVTASFDAVFDGTVVAIAFAIDSATAAADGRRFRMPVVRATVAVRRQWKGVQTDTVVVRTALDGAACGFGFTERGRYLIFAHALERGELATTKCSPTAAWGRDAERLVRLLRQSGSKALGPNAALQQTPAGNVIPPAMPPSAAPAMHEW